MGVNEKLIEVIAKLTEQLTVLNDNNTATIDAINTTNTKLDTLVEAVNTVNENVVSSIDRLVEIRELNNTMLWHIETIRNWDIPVGMDNWRNEQTPLLQSINDNVDHIKVLTADYITPMTEGILHGVDTAGRLLSGLTCLCDMELFPGGPPFITTEPADMDIHCRRLQYMLDMMREQFYNLQQRVERGASITNSNVRQLFLVNVVLGMLESLIPSEAIIGVATSLSLQTEDTIAIIISFLETNQGALIDAIFGAATASEAQSAVSSIINSELTTDEQLAAKKVLLLIFSPALFNTLYDQAANEWPIEDYTAENCGYPDSGLQTTIYSIDTQLAEDPLGTNAWQAIETARHYGYITNMVDTTFDVSGAVTFRAVSFIPGGAFNAQDLEDLVINGEYWHNVRIKYASGGEIHIRKNLEFFQLVSNDYYRFPVIGDDRYTIVAAEPDEPFTLYAQRLVDNEWTEL